jgi:hypothetical protein
MTKSRKKIFKGGSAEKSQKLALAKKRVSEGKR